MAGWPRRAFSVGLLVVILVSLRFRKPRAER
jgi:hypothetical protein